MINLGVWLSCYVYVFAIWAYLTTVNQCWTIFFSKDFVWLERCSLDEAKNSTKPFEKVELSKMPKVNSLFLTNSYIFIRNILLKSGLTAAIFFYCWAKICSARRRCTCLIILHDLIVVLFLLMRKTCKNLVCQEKLYLFHHTTWLFCLFKIIFWCYYWLSSGWTFYILS